jgi:hypothetical protein
MEMEDDPFAGLVIIDDGYLRPNLLPGLGVTKKV